MALRIVRGGSRGFSLLEMLVAIAVISAAGTVFVSLYISSLALARTAQYQRVAATLADAQLGEIVRHPEKFVWYAVASADSDAFEIHLSAEDPKAGSTFNLPPVLAPEVAAFNRDTALYESFRWKAQGRLPEPGAAYCEVTVIVSWKDRQRERVVALTSSVAASRMPAPSTPPEPGEPATAEEAAS